ncbi:hypothetical protein OKW40_001752 [Paraburkholderia sp. RAU6.4a]|uniref:hypothetical protein n=1 Tax=Paraburkholderia sp. RAU6.4a TaxID=2991067 RepID=UPI003D1FCC58
MCKPIALTAGMSRRQGFRVQRKRNGIGGDKLSTISADHLRNGGEWECVRVETLRAYDTRKKVRCSSGFP